MDLPFSPTLWLERGAFSYNCFASYEGNAKKEFASPLVNFPPNCLARGMKMCYTLI